MLKDEAGSADPVGVFWRGARACDNIFLAREGFFPLAPLEEEDEVAKLVDRGASLDYIPRLSLIEHANLSHENSQLPTWYQIRYLSNKIIPALSRPYLNVSVYTNTPG